MRLLATVGLALALGMPLAARADEMADKVAVAKALVDKTILKTLDTGFAGALEKTVAQMPEEKAEKVRKDARAEFDTQRQTLLDGISKQYAEKFSLTELKHLQGIYEDPIYQKYQAMNADPKSEINVISQAAVTKLLNMLTLAAAGDQKPGVPNYDKPMQMPAK
ncbi:hypothetical protein GCM10007884_34630 [Methylobacterium brachythecii]|nr:hypothetical protein GCM10007884_34630 [Methylobacterium brachythecii]